MKKQTDICRVNLSDLAQEKLGEKINDSIDKIGLHEFNMEFKWGKLISLLFRYSKSSWRYPVEKEKTRNKCI